MWISMKVLDATTSPIISSSHPWYKTGETYWEDTGNCPPTIDGVLGGYAHISPHDISGSSQFLSKVSQLRPQMKFTTACDCGAGIGRVTRDLLLVRFSSFVTLVEVSERLCREAVPFVGDSGSSRIKVFNVGMQDFLPSAGSFDCIWIQWVVGQLTDLDLVDFLVRCGNGLASGGVIVIKDNSCASAEEENSQGGGMAFSVDLGDSSVCRSHEYFLAIFELANMDVVLFERQQGFPEEIYPVPMFALCPRI